MEIPPLPHYWVPLKYFTLRLVLTEPLAARQCSLGVPALALLPTDVFACGFLLCFFLCLYICLSNFGGRGLPCALTSLTDCGRVVDFSVCYLFTF